MSRNPVRSSSFPFSFVSRVVFSCALVLAVDHGSASADETQTLTLKDGSTVVGTVVEYIAGDHVTLLLATGEKRRIEWSALSVPAPAPRLQTGLLPALPPPPSQPPPPTEAPIWSAPQTSAPTFVGPANVSPSELGELRPQVLSDPESGMSSEIWLGVQTGWPSPYGYLALAADYFPFRWPALRWLGLEAIVALPIADEPVTLGESLSFQYMTRPFGMGVSVGLAESFAKTIIPGDKPGVVYHFVADATRLTYRFTPYFAARASLGLAFRLNEDDYCKAHPEACPQISELVGIHGALTLFFTFDVAPKSQ